MNTREIRITLSDIQFNALKSVKEKEGITWKQLLLRAIEFL